MSAEAFPQGVSKEQLSGYSTAALLVLQSRLAMGNGSPYDRFLCDYIGDPVSSDFRPVYQRGPSGREYGYNSSAPGQVRRSFSHTGTLLNIRHVQGPLEPGDELLEYFIASLDLYTGTATEWRVVDVGRQGSLGKEIITIGLSDKPDITLVANPSKEPIEIASLEAVLGERSGSRSGVSAQVVLDVANGCYFSQSGGLAAPLCGAEVLVSEVNELTRLYGLTDLDTLRERASRTLAQVVPLQVQVA